MIRILVIEDDAAERQLFKVALERAGYEVIDAENGEVGCQLYRQQPCELIVTDIFMPEKEGLETIQELKNEFPAVKIIAISGGSTFSQHGGTFQPDEALIVAKVAGADRTLGKPIKIRQLLAMVEELVTNEN